MEEKQFKINCLGQDYSCFYVRKKETALQILSELQGRSGLLAIDTETTPLPQYSNFPKAGLSPHLSTVRLLQISDPKNAIVIDLRFCAIQDVLPKFLKSKSFIAHNAMFELSRFLQWGVKEMKLGCTRILYKLLGHAHYPTDAGLDASLSDICKAILKVDVNKASQTSDWSPDELSFEQIEYAALDPIYTLKIAEALAPGLKKYGLEKIYKLSTAAQLPLCRMELNGMCLDTKAHNELILKWRDDMHSALKKVQDETGLKTITSHTMSGWLFQNLPKEYLDEWPKTPTGKLSTASDAFTEFGFIPVVAPLAEYQKVTTALQTFGTKLSGRINPETKRLHSSYNICGARTGRLSSRDPNLQNCPRTKEFRSIFVSSANAKLVRADYNQIEIRVAAELSRDKAMLTAYREGVDIHRLTASKITRKVLSEVTENDRQVAKAYNFGLMFGLGATKFSRYAKKNYGIEVSELEAKKHIEAWYNLYSGYRDWQLSQALNAKDSLVVTTPLGKRRRLPEDNTYGNSMNHPVQGGAAEVMLSALVRVEKAFRTKNVKLLNTVHDEIILEVLDTDEVVEEVARGLAEEMTKGFLDVFPGGITNGLVAVGIGKTWADAK